jgi:hypothetical protein
MAFTQFPQFSAATLPLSITASIKLCFLHCSLFPTLPFTITTIKRQCLLSFIATVISLVAGLFCCQSLTAALRQH